MESKEPSSRSTQVPDDERAPPTLALRVEVNLAGIHGRAARAAQRIIHLVAAGLSGTPPTEGGAFLPGAGIQYVLHEMSEEQVRTIHGEYPTWILLNGFRDLSEQIGAILQELFHVLALWHIGQLQDVRAITVADYDREVPDALTTFDFLPFPDKVARLRDRFGFEPDPVLTGCVRSIIAVRNCLVHRHGIVGERDLDRDGTGRLALEWIRFGVFAKRADAESEVSVPFLAEADTQISIKQLPKRKAFALGERIVLDAQEFAEVAWTVNLFAQRAAALLEEHGRSLGVPFTSPPSAPVPDGAPPNEGEAE